MARIRTGIEAIDSLWGGLEAKRVSLLTGGIGTGKSLFGFQFLRHGLTEGERGLLISMEKPEDVLAYADAMGFPLTEPVRERQIVLLEYPPNLEDFTGALQDFSLRECIAELSRYVSGSTVGRVVIDPVTPLFMFHTGRWPHTFARHLVHSLESLGTTCLLTVESPLPPDLQAVASALETFTVGSFELTATAAAGHLERALRVRRLRGMVGPPPAVPFSTEFGQITFSTAPEPDRAMAAPLQRWGDEALLPEVGQELAREIGRASRYGRPLSLVVLRFGQLLPLTDEAGRLRNETLLHLILDTLLREIRKVDTIVRPDRETFVICLPETSVSGRDHIVQRIRESLGLTFRKEGITSPPGASLEVGWATYPDTVEVVSDLPQAAFAVLRQVPLPSGDGSTRRREERTR